MRRNVWWYCSRWGAIHELLQNKLYHPYRPSIRVYFPGSLFLDYWTNSNNRLSSYLQLDLAFSTSNIGLSMVLFCIFYSCQSINGNILRSLEAPFNLLVTLVSIFKMAFIFYLLFLCQDTCMTPPFTFLISAFMQLVFLLISWAISAGSSSILAILRRVTRLTSAYFSSTSDILSAIFQRQFTAPHPPSLSHQQV